MIKIVTSGHFDPLHRGHLELLRMSKKLGDVLFVIVASDRQLLRKYGYLLYPLNRRIERLLRKAPFIDGVVVAIDKDDSVCDTLRLIRPDIFTKGGDRNEKTMNPREIKICEEINCKIVYGMGDKKAHSHLLRERFKRKYGNV